MTSDIITLTANVALALSFTVGLIFGIAQVRAAARDRRDRLTLEALRNFQSREFAELLLYVSSHDIPASREEFCGHFQLTSRFIFYNLPNKWKCLEFLSQRSS